MFLQDSRKAVFISYNILITLAACALLVGMMVYGTPLTAPKELTRTDVMNMLLTMVAAGMAGGVLCNLRGIFEYQRDMAGEFPRRLELPFYVRPFAGAICALVAFFVGSIFVVSLSVDAAAMTWGDFPHRLPFVALGLLAGYVSQEFLERLKAVAIALFSEQPDSQKNAESKQQEILQALQMNQLKAGQQVKMDQLKADQQLKKMAAAVSQP